jgi:hypothetical protein
MRFGCERIPLARLSRATDDTYGVVGTPSPSKRFVPEDISPEEYRGYIPPEGQGVTTLWVVCVVGATPTE